MRFVFVIIGYDKLDQPYTIDTKLHDLNTWEDALDCAKQYETQYPDAAIDIYEEDGETCLDCRGRKGIR